MTFLQLVIITNVVNDEGRGENKCYINVDTNGEMNGNGECSDEGKNRSDINVHINGEMNVSDEIHCW